MARFTPQLLDSIRDRLTLSEVVGRRVTYDRRKSQPQKGDYWACCPFHNEKTPSFHVDDRRGIYHCFGCGVTGDCFRFLTEKDGLSFPEAVEQLAGEAGVALPKLDPSQVEREKERKSLYDVMALAQQYFLEQLQGPEGAAARGYLQKRGVSPQTQSRFGIGFTPKSRNGLKEYLASKEIEPQQMVEAGLLVAGPDVPVSYDKFRDRIMFPITDMKDRVIAFGGRAMSADNPAKYMNSPETPLFSKRTVLYNAAKARRIAYDKKRLIVVEGYMDVIALAQAGIEEAVAPLGTALTTDQLNILWKMADEPLLCFDGDEAGIRAAHRSAEMALPALRPGKTTQFVMLPDGQDPDDLLQEEGVDAMEDVLTSARSLFDVVWSREAESGSFDTPERKAALQARLRDIVQTIGDPNVRHHYDQGFREKMRILFQGQRQITSPQERQGFQRYQAPHAKFQNIATFKKQPTLVSDKLRQNPLTSKNYGKERSRAPLISRDLVLIGTLINHPGLLEDHLETVAELNFKNPVIRILQQALLTAASEIQPLDHPSMLRFLVEIGLSSELEQVEQAIKNLRLWQISADSPQTAAEIGWKQALHLHHKARTLNKELKLAESAWALDASETNWQRLLEINAQIENTNDTDALIEGLENAV